MGSARHAWHNSSLSVPEIDLQFVLTLQFSLSAQPFEGQVSQVTEIEGDNART